MDDDLFDKATIIASFDAIAEHLDKERAPAGLLIVVGGSYMALHGLRESTRDIDTVNRITHAIRNAVDEIARSRGFQPNWLNDRAAAFAPAGLTEADCSVLYEHPRLRVLGPPPDCVFLMKLYAAREPDYDDLVALWARCSFSSPSDAAARFTIAYPHAPDDPHLASYIAQIAEEAAAQD